MSIIRCWDCGNNFSSNYGGLYCNVCHQARKNRQHRETQSQSDRWKAEQAQWEAVRIQSANSQALINAENARTAAINRQTQVIAESTLTAEQAYKRGYEYIKYEWKGQNAANLVITIDEDGEDFSGTHDYVYHSDKLRAHFREGLKKGIVANVKFDSKATYNNLKYSAHQIGILHTQGSHIHFVLNPGVIVEGNSIYTKSYKSDFSLIVNEKDGSVHASWSNHFKDMGLNESYKLGVEEGLSTLNSSENKKYRLKTVVPKQKKIESQKNWFRRKIKIFDVFLTIGCASISIFSFFFILGITSGWLAILSVIFPIGLWIQLRKYQNEWRDGNRFFLDG